MKHFTRKESLLKLYRTILIAVAVLLLTPITSKASASKDVTKLLKYYKAEKYEKAARIAKKYKNKKVNEKKYRNLLSAKEQNAYVKVLKSYRLTNSIFDLKEYLWNYFVKDLDGDKKPELCVYYGSCEADVRLQVYKLKNGKAKKVDEKFCSHGSFFDIPGRKGILYRYTMNHYEDVYIVTMKKNKLKWQRVGGHPLYKNNKLVFDWMKFPYEFKEHKIRGKDYSVKYLSLSGVKKSGKIYPKK